LGNLPVTPDPADPGNPAARAGADGAGARAAAKLRLLGSSYTLADAVAGIQALSRAWPGFEAETLPAALLTLLEASAEPMPAAEEAVERFLSDERQPAAVAAFLRMRLEARRGRWPAALAQADACLLALGGLPAPAEEIPEARIGRLRVFYARYYPPIHLGKGFNTDINRAYRQDLSASAAPGLGAYARLLEAHCRETQARALIALGRPAEALLRAEAIPDGPFASVDIRSARAVAAEAAGDSARMRKEREAAFADRPLDTETWDKLAEALMRCGDRPALIAFLEDVLILARAFLPADQAERVRARLDQERGAR
jgi:hypothetical protein